MMSSTHVLCRGKRETHKTPALTDNMDKNHLEALIRQEERAIEAMKDVIVEAKRNAKSVIDGSNKRIKEAKENIKEANKRITAGDLTNPAK